jgi:carbon starvation protein CstA
MNISSYIYAALAVVVFLVGYFMYSLYQDNITLKENEVKY